MEQDANIPTLESLLIEPAKAADVTPNQEIMTALSEQLKVQSLDSAASAAKLVAEFAKAERNRGPLGEAGFVAACCALMSRAAAANHTECTKQAARAVGNLCFDHVDNRQRVLQCNGAEALSRVIRSTPASEVQSDAVQAQNMAGAGAVLNAAMDDPQLAASLVAEGVVENLLWFLSRAPSADQAHIAVCALACFVEVKEALERIARAGGVKTLLDALPNASEGDSDEILSMVREITNVDGLLPELVKDGSLWRLLELRTHSGATQRVATTAGLLLSAALSDDTCLQQMLKQDEERLVGMFVAWVQQDSDTDLRVTGALCIGNVARSDANCARLVANNAVIPALLKLLEPDVTATQHASLGALKNLANYAPGKTAILTGISGAALKQALHSGHVHIQYIASSLLRSILIHQQPAAIAALAAEPDLLTRLVHLQGSEEPRVGAESGRALTNFVRFGSDDIARAVMDAGAAKVFVAMLSSPHEVLRNEAAVALVRCGGLGLELRNTIRASGGTKAVTSQLSNASGPPELACTILALAATLLSDKDARTTDDSKELEAQILILCSSPHALVQKQACAVRDGVLRG